MRRTSGGRKSSSAASSVDLPTPVAGGGDDERDAPFDEQPERRRQLGVERAGPDQLDDGARWRWDVADGPSTGGRGVGQGNSERAGGRLGDGQRTTGLRERQTTPGPSRPDLRRAGTSVRGRAQTPGSSLRRST